jgi:hypothetical protein
MATIFLHLCDKNKIWTLSLLRIIMKKITFCCLTSFVFLFINQRSNGQDYKTAVGAKFGGYENGLSIKYFNTADVAIEGVLGFRQHGVVVTGLFEGYLHTFNVTGLRFFYGAGAHVGGTGTGVYENFDGHEESYNQGHVLLGVDGVIGFEYTIPKTPIAISLDIDPRIELTVNPFFDVAPALGLKYTF